MKLWKKISASVLAACCLLATAEAQNSTTINFGIYGYGTPITAGMFKGVVFTDLDSTGNIGAPGGVYVPETNGGGVTNSPTAFYPTSEFLVATFTHPATIKSFTFDDEGNNGVSMLYAYGSSGNLLYSTNISALDPGTLTLNLKGVSVLKFSNGGSAGWYFDLDDITYSEMLLFNSYALTPNQHAVAKALDYSVATNNPGIQNLVNYLGNQNTYYLPASFDMISGEELTSVFNTAYDVAHVQNSAITNHLAEYQAADESGVGTGLIALDMASGGKSTADGKDNKGGIVQPVSDNRWGFFATANGNYTDINGDFNSNGFQYATEGLTIGADYHLTSNLVLGGYLAYEHSFTNLVNNGAIDANGVTGGLYGSWFSHGFYVDGIVGGGYSGFTDRRLSVGGFTRGDGDDTILNAALNGGYDMHSGPWTFGPQIGVEYDDVWLDSFTENGSLAPLSVAAQSENSLRSTAGAHLSYTTHVNGVTVRPDIHAAWQHEYDSATNSLGAGIAGTNAAFVVQGPDLGRESALAGIGVTVDLSDKTSVYVNYEGQFGRQNTTQSDVSAGFSTKF